MTTPKKRAIKKAVANAVPVITPEDASNLIVLLNRVTVTGVQEAMCLGVLGNKLQLIKGNFEATNGKDTTPAS